MKIQDLHLTTEQPTEAIAYLANSITDNTVIPITEAYAINAGGIMLVSIVNGYYINLLIQNNGNRELIITNKEKIVEIIRLEEHSFYPSDLQFMFVSKYLQYQAK